MAQALSKIVDHLASNELSYLKQEEIGLIALIEAYAEYYNLQELKDIVERIRKLRVDVNGQRRKDLKQIAMAIRVSILGQESRTRQVTTESSTLKNIIKLIRGEE